MCVHIVRKLSTIMAGGGRQVEIRGYEIFWRTLGVAKLLKVHKGGWQNLFGILYLKYACQYYDTTLQWDWTTKHFHAFVRREGGLKIVCMLKWGIDNFTIQNISPPPSPRAIIVDNSLSMNARQPWSTSIEMSFGSMFWINPR